MFKFRCQGFWRQIEHYRAQICKRFRSPGIDSKESIPPTYVAWRAGTSNRIVVHARQDGNRFLGSLKGLQILALYSNWDETDYIVLVSIATF